MIILACSGRCLSSKVCSAVRQALYAIHRAELFVCTASTSWMSHLCYSLFMSVVLVTKRKIQRFLYISPPQEKPARNSICWLVFKPTTSIKVSTFLIFAAAGIILPAQSSLAEFAYNPACYPKTR